MTRRWWAVAATTGVILAAVYLLWAYQRAFTGEPEGENLNVKEITFRELSTVVPLLALSLFLGFYPKPLFDRTEVAVKDLMTHMADHGDYHEPKTPVHQVATKSNEPSRATTSEGASK